jgi:hypothetical protein
MVTVFSDVFPAKSVAVKVKLPFSSKVWLSALRDPYSLMLAKTVMF